MDLLNADYTFVNERLARHYGIPGIYGSRFRRVTLPNHDQRGGLLAHGSAAGDDVVSGSHVAGAARQMAAEQHPRSARTAAAARRGHQSDGDQAGRRAETIRERLAQHRKQPVCASCHSVIDPLGFALEHFDAIGGWRTRGRIG